VYPRRSASDVTAGDATGGASTGGPHARVGAAGRRHGLGDAPVVGGVRRDRQGLGLAGRGQRLVDEGVVGGPEHVGQQPPVPVARLGIALEADLGPDGEELGQGGRRLGPVALHRLVGVDALGCVDADEPHPLDPAAGDLDVEGVAVDEGDHDAAVGRRVGAGATSAAGRAGQGCDGEERDGARHVGLPVVWFRSAPDGARRLEALRGAG
jgi:hypothetical protein